MQKDILFYQANFEPEVCRMLDAMEKKNQKYFELFQNKTLKIVQEILNLAVQSFEKEEWFAIRNLVSDAEFINSEEIEILKKYGNPFSVKFAYKLNAIL